MPIEKGSAVYHQAVSREGAADLREGPRERGQAVWGGRAGAPDRDGCAEALVREGRLPLGAQAKAGALRTRGPRSPGWQPVEARGKSHGVWTTTVTPKEELYERARSSTPRRSKMSKEELAEAITRRHRAPGPIAHAASRRGRVVRRICCRRRLLGLSRDRATSPSEQSPLSDLHPAERAGWGNSADATSS